MTHPLITARFSPREFDAEAILTLADLRGLVEAARWAASAGNTQPARYVLSLRGDRVFSMLVEALKPGNKKWAPQASALILTCALTENEKGPLPAAEYGVGLAAQNLVLQATSLGLATHQLGGFDKKAVHESLGLPANLKPLALIAVGQSTEKPGHRDRLPLDDVIITP